MAIMVECNSCGKQYNAPESMAGKRVKCKDCGQVFQIPSNAPGDGAGDDLSALSSLEKTFHEGEPAPAGAFVSPPQPTRAGFRGSSEADDIPFAPHATGRANVRFRFPGAAEIDKYLPIGLVLFGLAGTAYFTLRLDDIQQNWLTSIRALVLVLCYVALIYPLALQGVWMAGRKLNFQMPRSARWRAFATFFPAFAIGILIWLAGGGSLMSLVLGVIAGLIVSLSLMMLLFRLWPEEIGLASVCAGGMFVLGVALSAGILLGLNLLLNRTLVATKKASMLPGSPFGMAFNWPSAAEQRRELDTNAEPAHAKPKPAEASPAVVDARPVKPNTPDAAGPAPNQPPASSGPLAANSTDPNSKPSVLFPPDDGEASNSGKPPAPDQVALNSSKPGIANENSPPEPAAIALPPIKPSQFVHSVGAAAIPPSYDAIIYPAMPSFWLAVTRGAAGQQGTVDRWSLMPGQPAQQEGKIPLTQDASVSNNYVLAPDGDLLARVSSFPNLCVLVYSFATGNLRQQLDLGDDAQRATAEVYAFVSPDRLLVRRRNEGRLTDSFEVWDARGKNKIKTLTVPSYDRNASSLAISPDGLTLAVAARAEPAAAGAAGQPTLYLFDVSAGASARERTRLGIPTIKTTGTVRPTGMVYSPDGSRLAILFEQEGNGLLQIYSFAGGRLSLKTERIFPPMPVQAPAGWEGSSLVFVGPTALLLYGQLILDSTTGESAGEIGIGGVISQRFAGQGQLQLAYRDPETGQRRLAIVRLNTGKIDELTTAKK